MRFDGTKVWNERTEHVAKHLERAAGGLEPQVQFGGENHKTFVDWSVPVGIVRRGDDGKQVLQNPLKGSDPPRTLWLDEEDADTEGEEVDYWSFSSQGHALS